MVFSDDEIPIYPDEEGGQPYHDRKTKLPPSPGYNEETFIRHPNNDDSAVINDPNDGVSIFSLVDDDIQLSSNQNDSQVTSIKYGNTYSFCLQKKQYAKMRYIPCFIL